MLRLREPDKYRNQTKNPSIEIVTHEDIEIWAERRIRIFAFQFGSQSIFIFTIHDYTHKSSLLTLFLVLVNFFTWYSLNSEIYLVIYRHLVCNKFDRAFLMLNLAFVLNLSDTCEDNFSWQTWREMNLLTQDASVFFVYTFARQLAGSELLMIIALECDCQNANRLSASWYTFHFFR